MDPTNLDESGVFGKTVRELDRALDGIQSGQDSTFDDKSAAQYVRAALGRFVAHGTVNAQWADPGLAGGERVNLGRWVARLRGDRERYRSVRYWVEPVMVALDMEWQEDHVPAGGIVGGQRSVRSAGASDRASVGKDLVADLRRLAAKVFVERPEAVRLGLDPTNLDESGVFGETVRELGRALDGIQSGQDSTEHDQTAARYVRAALGHFVAHGTVDAAQTNPPAS